MTAFSMESENKQNNPEYFTVTRKIRKMFLDWKETLGLTSMLLLGGVTGYALIAAGNDIGGYSINVIDNVNNYITAGVATSLGIITGLATLRHRGKRVEKKLLERT